MSHSMSVHLLPGSAGWERLKPAIKLIPRNVISRRLHTRDITCTYIFDDLESQNKCDGSS